VDGLACLMGFQNVLVERQYRNERKRKKKKRERRKRKKREKKEKEKIQTSNISARI